ncbi:MAG: hypothetical protein ABIK09_14210 [Pseudomonadota bacterium]
MRTLPLLGLLVALLGAPAPGNAGELQTGAQYVLVAPLAQMADQFGSVGHGLDIEAAYRFERVWLSVGASVIWTWLGESVTRPGPGGGVSENLRLRTDNTATLLDGFVRFQPRFGIVYPYVEGLLGTSFFNRTASLVNGSTRDLFISGERHSDVAFNWGAGAGVMIEIFKPSLGSTRFAIDLRLRYLGGLAASKYPAAAIIETDGIPDIEEGSANRYEGLHTLLAHVGFIIML